MSARSTALAIAVGTVAGALAALLGTPSAPERGAGQAPLKPIAQAATTSATPASPATSAAPVAVRASASAPDAPPPSASAAPVLSASAAATAAAMATSAIAPSGPLPDTKAALLKVEMRCDQRDAAACELAAAAYEQGSAGINDAAKAANYRKIGLTHWITQCDKSSPTACITLAERYRAGAGVPQSDRNADALIERARELCKLNPAAACADLPKSAAR